jgi:hypothetical protein
MRYGFSWKEMIIECDTKNEVRELLALLMVKEHLGWPTDEIFWTMEQLEFLNAVQGRIWKW